MFTCFLKYLLSLFSNLDFFVKGERSRVNKQKCYRKQTVKNQSMKNPVRGVKHTLVNSPPTNLVYLTQWATDVLSCIHDESTNYWSWGCPHLLFDQVLSSKKLCAEFGGFIIHELKLFCRQWHFICHNWLIGINDMFLFYCNVIFLWISGHRQVGCI